MFTPPLLPHFLKWAPPGSRRISFKLTVDGPELKSVVALAPPGSPPLPEISPELRAAAEASARDYWRLKFSTYLPFGDHYFVHCTIAPDHRSVVPFPSTNQTPETYWAAELKAEKALARSEKARATREANKAKKQQP